MNSQKRNVFIFPCGSEVGLELQRALAHSTYFALIGGSSTRDHGAFAFADHIGELPFVGDENLLPAIQQIVADRRVDFIFPAHDSAVTLFSMWAEQGLLGGARVMTSPHETCRVVRSKRQTYALLNGVVPVPAVIESEAEIEQYPVFLKPDVGQGSKGTFKAAGSLDVQYQLQRDPSLLILEYLPGKEYTIDCFTDRHGQLRFAESRLRGRISNGISVNAKRAKSARFADLANSINRVLQLSGAWFFQVKERQDGELVLMEIAARIAGASSFHRAMGVNLPLLSLFDAMGHEVAILENSIALEMDRQLRSRYRFDYAFDTVYVDLDDTLVEAGKVSHRLLSCLYRFKSEGKKLILISRHLERHGEDARLLLQSVFIEPRLFNCIIDVQLVEKKSDHVKKEAAIFIDDSFRERMDVATCSGIPVFDVGQIIELCD